MIIVVDPEKKTKIPFSRGILTRSITSTGVDVGVAYSIAAEIVKELERKKVKVITKDEIRKVTYKKLLDHGLKDAARKYLFWHELRRLKYPMIILLGGATGVGKSTLATELAFRLGIRTVIGTDTVREVMRKIISKELLPAIHTSSFLAWRELRNLPKDANPLIYGFESQVRYVTVGINAVVERSYKEGFNTIIEGIHLVPGYVTLNDRSFMYLITVRNSEALEARFYERARYSLRPAEYYVKNIDNIVHIQEYLIEKAKEYGIPIIENIELEESINSIMNHLMEEIPKRLKERGIELSI
ncbi:MAG: 2-phosphoglycerate kinase [Thermococcus sp.]|uniref:2-phosphoglycerate kinase n=1 Tax=Thermococcus litoralis TaxID=2265 RepID=A0A7C5K1R7_THELI|nr:2-phosphoglycerate kinase [Thermococcus sp.]RLF79482.1 MAG: 2-phosphoglycerate kinase [Thermococci archaeon]RLF85796.1 MAG: 2-phosphoglycerate kinase [Thermococci archaeon]HDD31010.1 2-phosphoglycerate kinase [Thermococcus litoralis]HHI01173.1 2-phosphoglycerate kinase [Thermococcus litoralis]